MKLRCTDSKTINYTPGFEYSAELGVTAAPLMARSAVMWLMVTTPGSFSTNQPSTPNAVMVRS